MKRSTALLSLFLATAFLQTSFAQLPKDSGGPSDVNVVDTNWIYPVKPVTSARGEQQLEGKRRNSSLGPMDREIDLYLERYRDAAVLVLENAGSKTISSVDYDFYFVDKARARKLLRYKLSGKQQIAPGEKKPVITPVADRRAEEFLAGGSVSSAKSSDQLSYDQGRAYKLPNIDYLVVINRVRYADGSEWKRP